jgi:hypothetical protein
VSIFFSILDISPSSSIFRKGKFKCILSMCIHCLFQFCDMHTIAIAFYSKHSNAGFIVNAITADITIIASVMYSVRMHCYLIYMSCILLFFISTLFTHQPVNSHTPFVMYASVSPDTDGQTNRHTDIQIHFIRPFQVLNRLCNCSCIYSHH